MRKYFFAAECVVLSALCVWLLALAADRIAMLVMLAAVFTPIMLTGAKLPTGVVKLGYSKARKPQ